jgi:hypothetical protein
MCTAAPPDMLKSSIKVGRHVLRVCMPAGTHGHSATAIDMPSSAVATFMHAAVLVAGPRALNPKPKSMCAGLHACSHTAAQAYGVHGCLHCVPRWHRALRFLPPWSRIRTSGHQTHHWPAHICGEEQGNGYNVITGGPGDSEGAAGGCGGNPDRRAGHWLHEQ